MKNEVTVKIPARIHMAVWDMNKFGLGKRGGGGIGTSIGLYTTLKGKISEEDIITGDSSLIAKIFLESIKERLGIQDLYFDINISRDYEKHIGLGSTGSVLVGLIRVVIELLDIQIDDDAIMEIVLDTMKEEHEDEITECFETTVGPWACLKKKMVIVDEECKLIKTYQFEKKMRVLLVTPQKKQLASSIEDETKLLEGRGRQLDKDAYSLKRYLLSYIKNIDDSQDLSIIKIVDLLKYVGSKRAEIEFQEKLNDGLYSKLIRIGEENYCMLSGMSSIGPTYYYIDTKEKLQCIDKELRNYKVDVKHVDLVCEEEKDICM